MNGKWQSSPQAGYKTGAPACTASLLLTRGRGALKAGNGSCSAPSSSPPPILPPIPGTVGTEEKPAGVAAGLWKVNDRQGLAKERVAGRGRAAPRSRSHQPSTQSREGSPLESSSCPWRTEGRVPATAARRLPAAAFRWKLVAPRPRAAAPPAAAVAAISTVCGLTGARDAGKNQALSSLPMAERFGKRAIQWESALFARRGLKGRGKG